MKARLAADITAPRTRMKQTAIPMTVVRSRKHSLPQFSFSKKSLGLFFLFRKNRLSRKERTLLPVLYHRHDFFHQFSYHVAVTVDEPDTYRELIPPFR